MYVNKHIISCVHIIFAVLYYTCCIDPPLQVATMKMDDPSDCLAKFKANKWLGLILFTGIVTGNLLKNKKHNSINTIPTK